MGLFREGKGAGRTSVIWASWQLKAVGRLAG